MTNTVVPLGLTLTLCGLDFLPLSGSWQVSLGLTSIFLLSVGLLRDTLFSCQIETKDFSKSRKVLPTQIILRAILAAILVLTSIQLHSSVLFGAGIMQVLSLVFYKTHRLNSLLSAYSSFVLLFASAHLLVLSLFALTNSDSLLIKVLSPMASIAKLSGIAIDTSRDGLIFNGQLIHVSTFVRPFMLAFPFACLFFILPGSIKNVIIRVSTLIIISIVFIAIWIIVSSTTIGSVVDEPLFEFSGWVILFICIGVLISISKMNSSSLPMSSLGASISLCAILITSQAYKLVPEAPIKMGEVWIDESHGKWEPSLGELDTLSYGRISQYNYVLLRKELEKHHHVSVISDSLPSSLTCDVLLLKVPAYPYSESEQERIRRFVVDGGTLFVIADHTNLFWSQKILNDIIGTFGIRLRDDASMPIKGREYFFKPNYWNSGFGNPRSSDSMLIQTGCSVFSNFFRTVPILICTDVAFERAVYSNDRFFGDLVISPDDRRGPACLSSCVRVGSGLIVVFGDSTMWSSFSFHFPGYVEMLNSLIYVSIERTDKLRLAFLLFSVLLITIPTLFRPRTQWPITVMGLLFLSAWQFALFPLKTGPNAVSTDLDKFMYVDSQRSTFELSTDIRLGAEFDIDNFSSFFATCSRFGLSPKFEEIDFDKVSTDQPILILNPIKPISRKEIRSIADYVRRGGTLLLLLNTTSGWPPAGSDLAREFGIKVDLERVHSGWGKPGLIQDEISLLGQPLALIYGKKKGPPKDVVNSLSVKPLIVNGEPLLVDKDGFSYFAVQHVGNGRVFVYVGAEKFSQFVFGDVWSGKSTDKYRRGIYSEIYVVLSSLR